MLFIHMAALIALEGVGIEAPHSARDQILKTILEREARYWDRTARRAKLDLDPALLRRAVAVATLAGARNKSEAAALLAAVPDWTDATGGARRSVARWLERLYPGPDWLNPLQPDLLGEKLVATVLEELPELARAVLQIATDEAAHRALTVLTRAARHYEAGRAALSDVLDANLPTLASLAITLAARTGDPFAHEARNNVLAAPQWEPSPQFIQYDGSDEVAPGLTRARLELEVRIAIGEELPGKRLILKDGLVNASEPEAVAIQVRDSHLAGVSSGQAAALHSYYEARLQRIRRFEELVQSYGFRAISSLQAIDEFMATGSWPVDPFPGVVQDPLLRRAWIENVIRLLKEHPRTFKLALVDRQACPLMRRAYWEIVGDRCLFFGVVVSLATTCALGHSFAPDVVAIFLGIFEDLWEALPSSSHDTRLVVARLERAIRHCPRQPRSAANQEAAPSRRI